MRFSTHTIIYALLTSLLWPGAALRAAPPTPVFAAEVRLAPFADRLEALGTLRARESVVLTASVTETVTRIHFDDGDQVAAGQVLVEMTSAEEHAQLEETRATREEAKSQYQRVKSLAAEGTAAKSLLDERQREWETARARYAAIVSRLDDRLIRAPFSGAVGLRNISVGALVSPGDVVTTLDDVSEMKLDFAVPTPFLQSLQPGLAIVALTPAYPEQRFEGTVKSIDSRVNAVTRTVVVRAVLPNPDRLLKPGMLMQVELLRNPRQALVIPEEALVPLGEKQFVLVIDEADGNKIVRREIKTGARRPGEVEILDGLQAGQKIITDGKLKVRPGQSVTIKAMDDGQTPLKELLKATTQNQPQP